MRSGAADGVSARSRIRDAALARFGADGVHATSVRAIAADAGVSPGLVLHHFGSKEGLRAACDEHVLDLVREKITSTATGAPPSVADFRAAAEDSGPLLAYLSRGFVEGSPAAETLYDGLVSLTRDYLAAGVSQGWARESEDPQGQAALLVTFELGVLVLGEHLSRALGVDVTTPEGTLRWSRVALEIYTNGLLTDDRWREALGEKEET